MTHVPRLRRVVVLTLAATLVAATTGCSLPNRRDNDRIDKVAATPEQVEQIYEKYRQVRNAAAELLDPKPLSTVETGPALAIDTGSFEVSQRLNRSGARDAGPIDVVQVETPRFDQYPLWIFAVVRDEERAVQRLQVFERTTAVDPWLLVATPEALISTELPEIRRGGTGHAIKVGPTNGRGMAMSAQAAGEAYASVLDDPEAVAADDIADDAFLQQMRETAAANAELEGVQFTQAWSLLDVSHVLRTSDGGALAFVTLLRSDTYTVAPDRRVTWPEGSPQQAFLQDGIQGSSGSLNYYHQIAIHLPGGSAEPRTIAQYGGVVAGDAAGATDAGDTDETDDTNDGP